MRGSMSTTNSFGAIDFARMRAARRAAGSARVVPSRCLSIARRRSEPTGPAGRWRMTRIRTWPTATESVTSARTTPTHSGGDSETRRPGRAAQQRSDSKPHVSAQAMNAAAASCILHLPANRRYHAPQPRQTRLSSAARRNLHRCDCISATRCTATLRKWAGRMRIFLSENRPMKDCDGRQER